jgi:adhesin transport system membrane fusion protein
MRHSDFAFANDIRAAVELRTPRTSRMLLMATLALLASGLLWAHFAVLDEVKRGNGKVVPSRQIQVVQSLEGGIVEAILVQEGAIVPAGGPLIRIDDTKFAAEFGEIRERRGSLAARVARLDAEAQGQKKPVFPADLLRDATRAVDTGRARENSPRTSTSSPSRRHGSPRPCSCSAARSS